MPGGAPKTESEAERPRLLEIEDLRIEFETGAQAVPVLDGVSLDIGSGETVCLVGESGSGKTVTALAIGRLLPCPPARYAGGRILVNGEDVLRMSARELRTIRGRVVSYVFQDPAVALNPVLRAGAQVREMLALHRPEAAHADEVISLLRRVGIPAPELRIRDYPHQLSGGMQQRLMLAMALASHPRLLVADEPTTALDVTIQAQILELLRALRRQLNMSILLITHNLGLVGEIADRVVVLYAGQIIEEAPARELLSRPCHPYTRALMKSVPELGRDAPRLEAIPGSVPRLGDWPAGCRFHPRCPIAQPLCSREPPALAGVAPGQRVRCSFWNHAP
ncbi:MAG TPA: ABC transporter ATP-binding protein [Verrucomicrobiota bacterium]|nr:ABC transporter ATP-binding protein [Verrucomicrobiota bacterium]